MRISMTAPPLRFAVATAEGPAGSGREAAAEGSGHGVPPMHWMDIAIPVGLAALWVFLFVRQLRARSLFPVNDPYLKEAFAHEAAH